MTIPRDDIFSMYIHKITKMNVGYVNLTFKIIRYVYKCNFLHLYTHERHKQHRVCEFALCDHQWSLEFILGSMDVKP